MARPLSRWAAGAAIVGLLAAIPVFIAVRLAVDGTKPVEAGELLILIYFCVIGSVVGVVFQRRHRPPAA